MGIMKSLEVDLIIFPFSRVKAVDSSLGPVTNLATLSRPSLLVNIGRHEFCLVDQDLNSIKKQLLPPLTFIPMYISCQAVP